jgi:hypothetical protein
VPHLLAADAAFYSGKNEAAAKAKGVKRVCIPSLPAPCQLHARYPHQDARRRTTIDFHGNSR